MWASIIEGALFNVDVHLHIAYYIQFNIRSLVV